MVKKENNISQEERAIVSKWIASEQGRQTIEAAIERQWSKYQKEPALLFDHSVLFRRVKNRINKQSVFNSKYIRYTMEMAAAILILFSISLFFNRDEVVHKVVPQQVEIYNPKGLRTTVVLPDSSRVTLNADSKISYADKFEGKTRTITLTGEAFFEVIKNEARPFTVHTAAATMTVLGTSFNVRSYPEDKRTDATLVAGALKVNESLLAPGHQLVIDNVSKTSTLHEVNTETVIAWTKGELHFLSMTFAEIATILGRKFSININIAKEELQEKILNGRFNNEESLEQILNVIQLSINFTRRYDPESNTLIIY